MRCAWVGALAVLGGCMLHDPDRYRRRGEPEPTPEGPTTVSVRASGALGDRCESHRDCASNFCLDITDDGLSPFCSRECPTGACPAPMVCRATVSGLSVCGFDGPPPAGEIGAACRFDLECVSGLCVDFGAGGSCTRPCDTRGCPLEMICVPLDDGRQVCAPRPPEGVGGLGRTCRSSLECQSGRCIDVTGDAFGPYCTALCSTDADCLVGMGCFTADDGVRQCVWRNGVASVGASCTTDADCASGLCIDAPADGTGPYCTDACRGDIDCPTGMACAELQGLGLSCIFY